MKDFKIPDLHRSIPERRAPTWSTQALIEGAPPPVEQLLDSAKKTIDDTYDQMDAHDAKWIYGLLYPHSKYSPGYAKAAVCNAMLAAVSRDLGENIAANADAIKAAWCTLARRSTATTRERLTEAGYRGILEALGDTDVVAFAQARSQTSKQSLG